MKNIKDKKSLDIWRNGRLSKGMDNRTFGFISSMKDDIRIAGIDIDVNESHSLMLRKQGIISDEDLVRILRALEKAREEIASGKFPKDDCDFIDIHPAIEQYVIDMYGIETGGKLHIAKSRNDQVMADVRIYLRGKTTDIVRGIIGFNEVLIDMAKENKKTIMPGYTHTRHAQVTSFAHYILSYVNMLNNDIDRLLDGYKRINMNPLGACALAGTSMDIDRGYTAELLGFDDIIENTIDAISGRDFCLELGSNLSIIMVNLSRIASDIILWSTKEFDFIGLADEFADISSAMPQKKNPDPLETIRGRSGMTIGSLAHLFASTRGLITGYHKDFQDLKSSLWEMIDGVEVSIDIFKDIFSTLKVNSQRMQEVIEQDYITALDLAETCVKKTGLSFRESHLLVGSLVKDIIEKNIKMHEINGDHLREVSRKVLNKEINLKDDDIKCAVDARRSIESRTSPGGPSEYRIDGAIKEKIKAMKAKRKELERIEERVATANRRRNEIIDDCIKNKKIIYSNAGLE